MTDYVDNVMYLSYTHHTADYNTQQHAVMMCLHIAYFPSCYVIDKL